MFIFFWKVCAIYNSFFIKKMSSKSKNSIVYTTREFVTSGRMNETTIMSRLLALEYAVNDTIPSILLKISEQQVSLANRISELQRSINDSIIN